MSKSFKRGTDGKDGDASCRTNVHEIELRLLFGQNPRKPRNQGRIFVIQLLVSGN